MSKECNCLKGKILAHYNEYIEENKLDSQQQEMLSRFITYVLKSEDEE